MPTTRKSSRALVIALGLTLAAAGCSSGSSDASDDTTTTTTAGGTSTNAGSSTTEGSDTGGSTTTAPDASDEDIVANPPEKSWEDALDAARQKFDGEPTKIELEKREDGGYEYKISLFKDGTESSVQYDADTLDELDAETDSEDSAATIDLSKIISLEDAADKARSEQDGPITEWKIEAKDDYTQYEFDIRRADDSDDEEVQIDAIDGSVRAS